MKKAKIVSKENIRRFAVNSTKASSALERRTVPTTFKRSDRAEQFLAARRQQAR